APTWPTSGTRNGEVRSPPVCAYGDLLNAVAKGDFFVSTGEVLLSEVRIATDDAAAISVTAKVRNTFPLEMVEIVWGDGDQTYRKIFPSIGRRLWATAPSLNASPRPVGN